MKKFLLSLGLVAMMLNLTNCAQYEDVNTSVDVKGDFELYASISRTANDGLNTVWSANDALNVFHAVTDMTTYTNDGQFKLESGSADRFLGNLTGTLDVEEEYDWYAFYPYSSYITTPANNSTGYTYIGSRSDAKQTQNGNNSMAHIAGSNYPMAGYAKAVGAASSPTVVFNHIASLVEVEVVNQLSEAITINEVAFTAEEDIIGCYYINFADFNNLQFTKHNNYQSNTATLNVVNGTAIEAGASAKFYMAIKPFTAEAGSDLTVKVTALVNGQALVYSKTINVAAATTFSAGKIKPIAVKYNVELPSAEEIIETIDFSKQGYANQTAITSFTGEYCNITFSKGSNNSNAPKYYNTSGTAVRCYGGNTFTISSENLKIEKVVFTFSATEANEDNCNNTISATPGTIATDTWTGSTNSVTFTISGTTGHRRIEKITITYGEPDPAIIASNPAAVAYNATSATISYELLVLTGTVTATTDAEWITAIDCNTEGKVVLTLTENATYTARTANVTLSKEGAEDKVVTVTQNGKPKPTLTLTNATINVDADVTTATIKYSYANLVGDVTATTTAEWIKSIDCSTLGQVVVTFDANTGDARSAQIAISSTDATSVTATITQAGAGSVALGSTWTYTFSSKQWTANGAKTLNSLSWTANGSGNYFGYDATKGQQFGSGNSPCKTLTISTSGYKGGIKTIKINTSGASSISAKLTVTVGGTQIGKTTSLTSTATTYTFTADNVLEGDIVLSYTQTSSKAIYIKSITIN